MKLQGKKTGALANFIGYIDDDNPTVIDSLTGYTLLTVRYKDSGVDCYEDYKTIKEFNEDWEDYKPDEPLIKDEKIRKAVRAWAEANDYPKTMELCYNAPNYLLRSDMSTIEFDKEIEPLQHGDLYTIEELCGEEAE